jgi:hypothetical protein
VQANRRLDRAHQTVRKVRSRRTGSQSAGCPRSPPGPSSRRPPSRARNGPARPLFPDGRGIRPLVSQDAIGDRDLRRFDGRISQHGGPVDAANSPLNNRPFARPCSKTAFV